MPQHIVARFDVFGNDDGPLHAIGAQIIRGIGAPLGTLDYVLGHARLFDLEELERVGIDRVARALAVGEVGHDGPLMMAGPLAPDGRTGGAGRDGDVLRARQIARVADDVVRLIPWRIDKLIVHQGRRDPAHGVGVVFM